MCQISASAPQYRYAAAGISRNGCDQGLGIIVNSLFILPRTAWRLDKYRALGLRGSPEKIIGLQIMAPPMYDAGGSPPSTFLAPTTDNQAIPQRKSAQHIPPSQGSHARHKNEPAAISRKLRPLSVNEALQYSPLSSIVPFNSGTLSSSETATNLPGY